jgi:hypothetical protein
MNEDKLLDMYGSGWFEGFLAAKRLSKTQDLNIYDDDAVLKMSDKAESERRNLAKRSNAGFTP